MENTQHSFRDICRRYGIALRDLRHIGISYSTAYQHWIGRRIVSLRSAIKYHQDLGIPIEEFFTHAEQ